MPFSLVHIGRETRKHHHPLRHIANHAKQPGDGGGGGGDARCTHKASGRCALPPVAQPFEQPRAPFRQINLANPRKFLRPAIKRHAEHFQRVLPVMRQFLCHCQIAQRARRHLFNQHLIKRARKLARQPHRLCRVNRCPGAGAFLTHQPGEDQPPGERLHGGRDGRVIISGIDSSTRRLAPLCIANRDKPGQQQSAAAGAHKCVGNRPLGAVIGKQHDAARQHHRIATEPPDQPRRQRISKGAVRRYGE